MEANHYQSALEQGVLLFNAGRFFEAHEVLEDLWRASALNEKNFLQGLVQIAVALHHYSSGNVTGATSVLARAERNLEPYPEKFGRVDLQDLRSSIFKWQRCFEKSKPLGNAKITLIL